jgi:hypothetical protein
LLGDDLGWLDHDALDYGPLLKEPPSH